MGAVEAVASRGVAEASLLDRAVFTAGDIEYSWGDVVVAARLRGDWLSVELDASVGLAALRHLHAGGEEIAAGDVDQAGVAFRYERDLLSGDELEAWLERWDLSFVEWSDWIGRALARERVSGRLGELDGGEPPDPDQVQLAAAVEAICSGALERWALELAERAAVSLASGKRATATGESQPPPARGLLGLNPAAWETARAKVAPLDVVIADAITAGAEEAGRAREVARHRLEWMRFDCRCLRFRARSAALEALACMREDGWSLEEVAGAAHMPIAELSLLLEDAPPPLEPYLVGAREGEVAGPVEDQAGDHLVLVVDRKREPHPGDPRLAARSRRLALDRAVRRELEAHVRWL